MKHTPLRDRLLGIGMGCCFFAAAVTALNVLILPFARECYRIGWLPELAACADRIVTILDGRVQSDVVQPEPVKEKNRAALLASLEGNTEIGGDKASGRARQKTAAELAAYAKPDIRPPQE